MNNVINLKPRKCLVKGCKNYEDGGTFIGNLCAPCHETLRTGQIHPANPTFLGELAEAVEFSAYEAIHSDFMRLFTTFILAGGCERYEYIIKEYFPGKTKPVVSRGGGSAQS